MKSTKWRGSKELNEAPDSPQWDFSGDSITITRTFKSHYDVCLSKRPSRGSEMQGYTGFFVERSSVRKSPGNMGFLSVVASGTAESATSTAVEEKFEVDWVELQRPLITNKCWLLGGPLALTLADRAALKKWEDGPDADIQAAYKYFTDNDKRTPAGGTALTANAQAYAEKILDGVDSWVQYVPVCRKTSLTVEKPSESAAGFKNTPDGFGSALPEDFEWLKTADRSTRTGKHGKWEQTEEWTGAESIDTDLYDEVV